MRTSGVGWTKRGVAVGISRRLAALRVMPGWQAFGQEAMFALERMAAHSSSVHRRCPSFQPRALALRSVEASFLPTDGFSMRQGPKKRLCQREAWEAWVEGDMSGLRLPLA